MAEASKSLEMDCPLQNVWSVITQYEKYPEFVAGVHSTEVLSRNGSKVRVRYSIELLGKEIHYTLDHEESAPTKMFWTLVESNIMKSNEGGWDLEERGGMTIATYRLALDLKIFVPGMVLNGLVKKTLPSMLEAFEERAKLG